MRTLEEVLAAHPPPFLNGATLTDMQKEDIQTMADWGRALADLPVGSGKTAQATYAALMLDADTTVIILPPVLVLQWVKWLRSIPNIGTVIAYEGSPAERAEMKVRGARWIVMSFQIFKNDYKRLVADTLDSDPMLVVDEAHAVKNSKSKLYKVVRDYSAGRPLLLMTGTSMSKPDDAYAYVKLNTPTIYATLRQFENIHVEERDFFDKPIKWQNLDMLQENLSLRRVRRTKEEVHAALPKANYIEVNYALDKPHMALYKRLMEEQILQIGEGKIDATTANALYHAAQQIIVNYGYFADDEERRPATFDLIDQVCDEINIMDPAASKFIIWVQYKRSAARLLQYMNAQGIPTVAAYSGADSKKSVAAFMDDPKIRCLVANPLSAGMGLNPQHLCWECLFVESPTVTIPFIQAAGRLDRFGQMFNPNIRIAMAINTVQQDRYKSLLANDDLVNRAAGIEKGIRSLIFPD